MKAARGYRGGTGNLRPATVAGAAEDAVAPHTHHEFVKVEIVIAADPPRGTACPAESEGAPAADAGAHGVDEQILYVYSLRFAEEVSCDPLVGSLVEREGAADCEWVIATVVGHQ
jgi:hypothetical protein